MVSDITGRVLEKKQGLERYLGTEGGRTTNDYGQISIRSGN